MTDVKILYFLDNLVNHQFLQSFTIFDGVDRRINTKQEHSEARN